MRFSIFSFIFLLLFSSFSLAIGVTPADYKINFEPGLEQDFTYYVQNNRFHPINALVELEGEEANAYLSVSKPVVPLAARGTGAVTVHMKLPDDFEVAGWHYLSISIIEDFEDEQSGFSVRTASIVPVKVFVPFPGKYAELRARVQSVAPGQQGWVRAEIQNKGEEDLSDTRLSIKIKDTDGSVIREWEEKFDLKSKAQKEITKYAPDTLEPGMYPVSVVYEYGDKRLVRDLTLKVGFKSARPIEFSQMLPTGKFTQFEVKMESDWNQELKGVYALVSIEGQEGSTAPIALGPFAKGTAKGYIDLTEVEPGDKRAKVTVLFDDFKHTEYFDVELYVEPEPVLEQPKSESVVRVDNNIIIFSIVLIVLVIVALIIILTGKKGGHHGGKEGHTQDVKEF